jgi:Fe-S-cluster containining protein
MILSEKDINSIMHYFSNRINKEHFIFMNLEGFYQLKNTNNHCIFFEPISKTCKIYKARPQGCRFYPLAYDPEKKSCYFDEDCPRPQLFYQDKKFFKNTCERLKKFLRDQLHLDI